MGDFLLITLPIFKILDEIYSTEGTLGVVFHKSLIPINKKTRSLNVAMSVAIVASEALRQNNL